MFIGMWGMHRPTSWIPVAFPEVAAGNHNNPYNHRRRHGPRFRRGPLTTVRQLAPVALGRRLPMRLVRTPQRRKFIKSETAPTTFRLPHRMVFLDGGKDPGKKEYSTAHYVVTWFMSTKVGPKPYTTSMEIR